MKKTLLVLRKEFVILTIAISFYSCSKKSDPTPSTQTVVETKTIHDTIYKYIKRPEPKVTYGTVLDNQGTQYKTVTVGGMTWMAENLRVQYYNNGDKILTNNAISGYSTEATPRYWFNPNFANAYGNDDSITKYGRLYTWYAALDIREVCPSGWTIPSVLDWQTLIDTLGGANIAGDKLKEVGSISWNIGNGKNNSTNSSGFSARGAGLHNAAGGGYFTPQTGAFFWSSTSTSIPYTYDTTNAYSIVMGASSANVSITPVSAYYGKGKNIAYSVRCIKIQ